MNRIPLSLILLALTIGSIAFTSKLDPTLYATAPDWIKATIALGIVALIINSLNGIRLSESEGERNGN